MGVKKLLNFLFPAYSKWHDVGMYERAGYYRLIQVRYRLDNNRKQFRTASAGFVNDHTQRASIYERVLSIGL